MRGLWESLGLLHNKEIGRCLAKRQNQTLWTLQCWELGAFAALNDLRPVLRIQWWLNLRTEVERDCNPVSFSDLGTRLDQFALSGRMPCDAGE